MENLPRGYGPAAEEPPIEREPHLCKCGHHIDQHIEPQDLEECGAECLNTIREALRAIDQGRPIEMIEHILTDALVICQVKGCQCTHFKES